MSIETTIVIPTYNADKTLHRLLTSIFESDYPKDKLEVIVVDNNSKDDSKLVAMKFDVKYVNESQQGRSYARNRGIAEAGGKFIGFLDADTYIEADWIAQMVKHLSPDFVGGGQGQIVPSNVDRRSSLNNYRYRSVEADTEGSFSILDLQYDESPMINSAACMYKKEALERVGGFDLKLERHEDIDLAKRVLYSGYDLFSVKEAVAHVVFHGGGWTNYMTRWFWDGYYKGDYIAKWSSPLKLHTEQGDEEAPELKEREEISKHLYKAGKNANVTDGDPFSETIEYDDKELFGKEALSDDDFDNIIRDLPFDPRDHYKKWEKKDDYQKKLGKIHYMIALKILMIDLRNFVKQRDVFWLIRFFADVLKIFGRVGGIFKPKSFTPVEITLAPQSKLGRNQITHYGNQLFFNPKMRFVYTPTSMYAFDIEWGGVIDFPEMLKKHLRNIMVGNGGVVDDKFFTHMEKYVFWRSSIIYPWFIRPYLKRYLKEVIVGPTGKVDEAPLLASFQRMKILETFTRVNSQQ